MSELQKNLKKSRSLETPVKFASNLGKRCLKPDVTLFYLLYLELDFAESDLQSGFILGLTGSHTI